MTGITLNRRRLDVPTYMRYITDRLDALAESATPITQDELFKLCLHPKPLQLFFAEYLSEQLVLTHALRHEKSAHDLIDEILERDDFLNESPPVWKRNGETFAMTKEQFETAAQGMANPFVKNIAILLQTGTDIYLKELIAILEQEYKVPRTSGFNTRSTLKSLNMGPNFQSFWKEFLPFLAHAHETHADGACPFSKAFDMARDNHGFKAHVIALGDARLPSSCPAQHMIKHLLNTDLIEQPDGTLAIAANPRPGALPAFIYRKLKEQAAAPCPSLAYTPG